MARKKTGTPAEQPELAWLFSDLPADEQELRFEFEPLAKTLAELALNPGNRTPFTVVVRGGWGRGKTTLLRRARRMVESPELVTDAKGLRRVETLWFNAWKYPDEDTVLAGLLGALLDKLHRGGWQDQLKKLVAEYKGSVLAGALRAAAPWLKELLEVESKFSPAEEKRAFYDTFRELFAQVSWMLFHGEGALQDLKGRDLEKLWDEKSQGQDVLAIFLDDLDRCSRQRVVEVLQAINLFLDLPGVCFFLGIDGDRLMKVLPETVREEGEEFLEKMIQVAFDLPEVAEEDAETYIQTLVERTPLAGLLDPGAPRERPSEQAGRSDAWVIARALKRRHPRHVKRFLNDLSMGLAVMRSAKRLGDASPALPPPAVLAWHLLSETLPAEKWADLRSQPKLLKPFLGDWQEAQEGTPEEGETEQPGVLARLQRGGLLDRHIAVLARLDDAQIAALHLASPPALEPRRRRTGGGASLLNLEGDAWRSLEGGTFRMGADDISSDEQPIHPVELSPFAISRFPVTNADYLAFVRESGLRWPEHWESGEVPSGLENHPVVYVSWSDAEAFCAWATKKTGGQFTVTLPTEAQWEFAARGAEGRKYPWGDEEPDDRRANFEAHVGRTTPVDGYPQGATPEGVYDLAGNVWEWCRDWHGPYPTPNGPLKDPTGPSEGSTRVLRGGAFYNAPKSLRGACRGFDHPEGRIDYIGFRVVWSSSGRLASRP